MVGSLASKFVNKKIFPGTNHEVDSILYIYIYCGKAKIKNPAQDLIRFLSNLHIIFEIYGPNSK